MSKEQIETLVRLAVLALEIAGTQLALAEGLTEEEKKAFIARIKAAQLSVPNWD